MHRITLPLVLLMALTATSALAQPATGRGFDMDYGPVLDYTVQSSNEVVSKGITIRLADGTNRAAVLFDTDTMRFAAGWTGGWLDLSKTHLTTYKGELPPRVAGEIRFTNTNGPGWAHAEKFDEPRANGIGPLPRDWAHYRGLFRHGDKTILSYTVGSTEVLELPEFIEIDGARVFSRTLHVGKSTEPLTLRVCDVREPTDRFKLLSGEQGEEIRFATDHITCVAVSGGKPSAELRMMGRDSIQLRLPASSVPATFRILLATAPLNNRFTPARLASERPAANVSELCRGGPLRWPESLTTAGRRAADSAPYVVDTITVPENNPWRSWMRLTALDFFSDGRAAVTTWNGDVWIVSGIDDSLHNVKWKRFAAGLFDPLGLRVLNDKLYVLERSQLTRLNDLNGDGEADFYENFNNDAGVSPSYHAFAMDLQTDSAGNFYYVRCGQRVDTVFPLNGGMVKVSADGTRAELIAHGLRAANGMSIGPQNEITCADNQGNWTPSSRINLVKPGAFYGYVPHAHTASEPTTYEPPLCWIPMAQDNSSGGQVWVTSDKWGPLQGHMLHTSYGMASLFDVLWETVNGVPQGGVVKFPLKFDSGIMRARIHPRDGQVYVAGLKGWQTKGVRDGALQRVRYTGKPLHMPNELHVRANGIEIGFTDSLDRASAEDVQNYGIEQWNYRWTEKYGSDDYSVAAPEKKGHDTVELRAAKLSPDGKQVLLEIPGIRPVMQMKVKFSLKAADGGAVDGEIYNTINRVPTDR